MGGADVQVLPVQLREHVFGKGAVAALWARDVQRAAGQHAGEAVSVARHNQGGGHEHALHSEQLDVRGDCAGGGEPVGVPGHVGQSDETGGEHVQHVPGNADQGSVRPVCQVNAVDSNKKKEKKEIKKKKTPPPPKKKKKKKKKK